MEKQLYVISHTHWDREWYQPFQEYRVRLVRMMDDLLDVLEREEDFAYFHLDGQTIVLEDYLEIRPQNKERLSRLIDAGRIIIGPWYVMPDEFLISGESLVRNLQLGHQKCRMWNTKPMPCGYVTDIFGHNSQFPQILRGFGIDNALLYRGIGDYPKDAFSWQGADGSTVTAFKMDCNRSYSNFYFAVRWPFEGRERDEQEMIERMEKLISYMEPQCHTDVMLMLDGVDHIDCEPELPRMLERLEEKLPGVRFIHTRFEDYKAAYMSKEPALETISGPLYHPGKYGVNNQVLKNVLSSMVFLKQDNDQCERLLTSWAEPLDTVTWLLEEKLPLSDKIRNMDPRSDFHAYAWKTLIQNHPHDSICGCSIGDVHQDNRYRFRQSRQVAEASVKDSIRTLCAQVNTAAGKGEDGAVILFNPSDREIDGVTVFELELTGGSQKNYKFYGPDGEELPYQIIASRVENKRVAELRELIRFVPTQIDTIAMQVKIPAHGYATYGFDNRKTVWVDPTKHEYTHSEYCPPVRYPGSMWISADTFDTGKLTVKIEPNGTLTVTEKTTGHVYSNLLLPEDSGDCGDGWVFRKPEMDSMNLGLAGDCDVLLEADGPLVAEIKVVKRLRIPKTLANPQRHSEQTETAELVSVIRLRKDSSQIEVRTAFDNRFDNHRLRVSFDTDLAGADAFYTKTPYDMQKWSITKEDTSDFTEKDTLENSSQGVTFLQDGEATFALYTRGLYEVECRDNPARTIVLTLLRAVDNAAGFPEGREIMRDSFTLEYCLDFAPGMEPAQAWIFGEQWRNGLRSKTVGKQAGTLPERMSFYQTEGNGNTVITAAVHRDYNGQDVLRLLNVGESEDSGVLRVNAPITVAYEVDFTGRRLREFPCADGKITYILPPKKLMTIELCR